MEVIIGQVVREGSKREWGWSRLFKGEQESVRKGGVRSLILRS